MFQKLRFIDFLVLIGNNGTILVEPLVKLAAIFHLKNQTRKKIKKTVKQAQIVFIILLGVNSLFCQSDSTFSKLSHELDFRFRAEQDWDSRKSDGSYRDNRSRLRYRLRTGVSYSNKHFLFGFRIRTGDQRKQQDPQLTIGKGLKEFGTLPIGFEKLYFQYDKSNFKFWLGKNTFPFKKNNELFWSDNVFPEGVSLSKNFILKKGIVKNVHFVAGHFILSSNDKSFLDDAYFQGAQINLVSRDDKYEFSSAIYQLKNIPDIPDGAHLFEMNYSIIHLRTKVELSKFSINIDYYNNFTNYDSNLYLEDEFVNQKVGYTLGLQYGNLKSKKNWMFSITYARLERYSILDYMAQNDWARWDYSLFNSPDGRLSNFRGLEAVIAYAITKKVNLVSKYYIVEQLLPFDLAKENGQRIRFDLNIRL